MAIQTADVIMPGNDNAFETGRRGQISSIAELDESYRWMLEKNVTATLATMKRDDNLIIIIMKIHGQKF